MAPDIFALTPERLVIQGFRNVMAAHDLSDSACWEQAWTAYIDSLGSGPARRLMGELQFWTRAIRTHSQKPMRYFPCSCRHICHDECMAVSAVAAAQAGDRACTDLAGLHLLGTADEAALTELWLASSHFAAALKMERLELYPVTASVITSINAMEERAATKSSALH
ncbi:MAG: hypothetical protein JNM45_11265 [Rhizobiales bacterium]|nr:hypothetical protein [Hyphomicrobiales bacterium]